MFQAEKCMESEPRISKLSVSIFGLLTVILCFFSVRSLVLVLGMRTLAVIIETD